MSESSPTLTFEWMSCLLGDREARMVTEADMAEAPLSREDDASIRALSEELKVEPAVVAKAYGRELARLRASARVTAFLPLIVTRLVRRSHLEAA